MPKTWEAADVKLGKFSIYPRPNGVIAVERRYTFVDAAGNELELLSGGRVTQEFVFTELPASIQSALTAINDWTYQRALEQEGMV